MKRIQYGAEAFDTSDEVAGLLLELGATLARAGSAEVVAFPAVDDSGGIQEVQFVIGPATHLSVHPERSVVPDPVDEVATKTIRQLLERNTPRHYEPVAMHSASFGSYADDF